jgi:predicted RNA methylase
MVKHGWVNKEDVVLDYGCGKGRVDFFLSYRTMAKTIGVEYDAHIYASALENRKTVISKVKPEFVLTKAEEYAVPADVNRCYFFNPFSASATKYFKDKFPAFAAFLTSGVKT